MITIIRKPLCAKKSPDDGCRINVTAKAAHIFSPAPDLVRMYKNKEIYLGHILDESQYKLFYLNDLHMVKVRGWVQGICDSGVEKITFLCYCGEGKFCHTHIIIEELLKQFPDVFKEAPNDQRQAP